MKSANDRGTLVLLENLDPSYTSSEVQVCIIPACDLHSILVTTSVLPLHGVRKFQGTCTKKEKNISRSSFVYDY